VLCHSPSCDELGFERHGSEGCRYLQQSRLLEGCRHTCSNPFGGGRGACGECADVSEEINAPQVLLRMLVAQ